MRVWPGRQSFGAVSQGQGGALLGAQEVKPRPTDRHSAVGPDEPATASAPVRETARRGAPMYGAAVFLAALLLFLPTLGHDFVWDDLSILLPNQALGDWSRLGEVLTSDFFRESDARGPFDYWRPLVVLSHMVERSLFGDRPAGYHAVNVLLHAAASLLVFLLGLRALGRPAAALAAGLLFAVHPVHVEVVAWVSGRSDLLLGLFLALALLGDWQGACTGRRRWQALALAGFAAALGAKESAAVFPAMVAARALVLGPPDEDLRGRITRAGRAALPFLLILGAFLLLRYGLLDVEPPQDGGAPGQRLTLFWTWWSALSLYARLLLWPAGLSIVHELPLAEDPWSWTACGGMLVLALAAWGALRLRHRAPGAAYGLLLLLLGLAPLANFLVPITSSATGGFAFAERFLYAPSIGFCLALGWLLTRGAEVALARAGGARDGAGGRPGRTGAPAPRRLAAAALVGLVLAAGSWASARRARDWRSEAALFAATVEQRPASAMARLNYGTALRELAGAAATGRARQDLLDGAQEHLEEAVALAPDNYRGHYNLANLHLSRGRLPAAESSFREALRLRPDLFRAMVNLGAILAQTERPIEALEWFERASRLEPGNLALLVNRAHVLQDLGRPEEAIPLYRHALAADPGLAAARAGLERALEASARSAREGL